MDDYDSKLRFLERLLGKSKYSHNTKEALFYCPFCKHHKQKLSINLKTDRWQCFPCGRAGKKSIAFIIREVGKKSDIEQYFRHYAAVKTNISSIIQNTNFELSLPEEFVPLISCRDSLAAGRKVWQYVLSRGISETDILRYKIGTAFEGQYKDRVIFPSFDRSGNVNLFTARSIESGTYLSPSVPSDYKNTIILNELNIDWTKPVIIVEGFVDMLKTTGNAIPLFGSSMTTESVLFEKIVMSKVPVYLALDVDADRKKQKIAKNFMSFEIPVYDINVSPFNDVGEMNREDFSLAYKDAKHMSHNDILRNRIRSLC